MIFLLFALANAMEHPGACLMLKGGRDALLSCGAIVDTNHDEAISPSELTTFVNSVALSDRIFSSCDLNHDGLLTVASDWNATNACGYESPYVLKMCFKCQEKGWVVPT